MQCHHVVIPGWDQESDSLAVGRVLFIAGICACIETSSLVQARDDAVGGTVLLFCKCIHYSSVH